MGQSKLKRKKFLSLHPYCCFCGGDTQAETIDHIPARSFFVDRKHPRGMEYPACKKCQSISTDQEDLARLVLLMQGTSYNPNVRHYLDNIRDSYNKGLLQRRPEWIDTGDRIAGNSIVNLKDREQECIIEVHRKLALCLYYEITGKILAPDREMILTFFTANRGQIASEFAQVLTELPQNSELLREDISSQFTYRYLNNPYPNLGFDVFLGVFLHGLSCFITFMFYSAKRPEGAEIILTPYEHRDA